MQPFCSPKCNCWPIFEQMCYVSSTFAAWDPKTASIKGIPSGRAPGVFGGDPIECEGLLAVDPNDRNHFIYAPTGPQQGGGRMHSEDVGQTIARYTNHSSGIYMAMITYSSVHPTSIGVRMNTRLLSHHELLLLTRFLCGLCMYPDGSGCTPPLNPVPSCPKTRVQPGRLEPAARGDRHKH